MRPLIALFLLLIALPAQAAPLQVVTSFTILGEMTQAIGGEAIKVRSLVGPNGDAHTYQPTPDDAKAIAQADLVIVNGLHFEGWMERLAKASGMKSKLVIATEGVAPRVMKPEGSADASSHAHATDPHAWQDPRNAAIYVRNIANALEKILPAHANEIEARAQAYAAEVATIDADIRAKLKTIPDARRKIITSHDAFGYFGAAYGIQFLSPVGISTEAEPSASDVAKLIRQIKAEGVKTVFIENMTNPRLVQQIAAETGAKLGGSLYADSLSPTPGPTPTYPALLRHNADLMLAAMGER